MEKYYLKAPQLTQKRIEELSCFQETIGIKFSELRLLNLAFTHTSYANEVFGDVDNNERLEFLGDSILGMVTAEYLFENLP
ncbi:MAG: ribonuclease III, partial [Bullifex sp.]|nr:ribonuclease III [Bullifex sp.]